MFDDNLRQALAALSDALDLMAAVDLAGEDDRIALDATIEQQRLANRLAAEQVRLLGHVDRRDAYRADAAVTLASWYRSRTRLDHGEAIRRVHAAQRLPALPRLEEAFAQGAITAGHVTAVTEAAIPQRAAAIAACEHPLVDLALQARPHHVKVAVRRIRDIADPDGTAAEPLPDCGPDPRRYFDVHPTIDGLVEGRFLLDQVDGEALLTVLKPPTLPIPPTPYPIGGAPTANAEPTPSRGSSTPSSRPAACPMCKAASRRFCSPWTSPPSSESQKRGRGRLRFTGDLDADRARHLALRGAVTVVLTMGPWRMVNVGRRFRTLPAWLRLLLDGVHRHCRGPDCDRPIVWTEAHHQHAWHTLGETDLNATIPLCKAHHDLVTVGEWTARFDPDTGTVTWIDNHKSIEVPAAA